MTVSGSLLDQLFPNRAFDRNALAFYFRLRQTAQNLLIPHGFRVTTNESMRGTYWTVFTLADVHFRVTFASWDDGYAYSLALDDGVKSKAVAVPVPVPVPVFNDRLWDQSIDRGDITDDRQSLILASFTKALNESLTNLVGVASLENS